MGTRDRFQLRSRPRSIAPPDAERFRSVPRRRHEPVRLQAAQQPWKKTSQPSPLLTNLGVGNLTTYRSDQPSSNKQTSHTVPKRTKGPHSTRAGEELREGEVYLDNVRIPHDTWSRQVLWALKHPQRVKTANEVAESETRSQKQSGSEPVPELHQGLERDYAVYPVTSHSKSDPHLSRFRLVERHRVQRQKSHIFE